MFICVEVKMGGRTKRQNCRPLQHKTCQLLILTDKLYFTEVVQSSLYNAVHSIVRLKTMLNNSSHVPNYFLFIQHKQRFLISFVTVCLHIQPAVRHVVTVNKPCSHSAF
jgi:hypothetical protein